MMQDTISPESFVEAFTPLGEAELLLHVLDDRPPTGLKRSIQFIKHTLKGRASNKRDQNDVAYEVAKREILKAEGRLSTEGIIAYLSEKYAFDHLRKFEYAFQAECLLRDDVQPDHVVDVGGGVSYSTVVPMLLELPNCRITSIDVVNRDVASKYNVTYVKGNCIETNMPDESATAVTIISTLEHVGLGRWGDPLDTAGDLHTMDEIYRILNPGGHVILTVPYGYPTVVYNLHRIYDAGRIAELCNKFEVIESRYTMHGKRVERETVEGKKASRQIPGFYENVPLEKKHPSPPGGVLLLLKKP